MTNVAPVAVNDSYSTEMDLDMSIPAPGVLGNDTDLNGNSLTAVNFSGNPTSHGGTVALNSNGAFTYHPATGYTGADSFTYQASDGLLTSNTATVNITVNEAQPPVQPSTFYGNIQYYSGPPVGGVVEAFVPGNTSPVATKAIVGSTTLTYAAFDVPGDITGTSVVEGGTEGGVVTFVISGRVVAKGNWHSGTNVQLNFHPPDAVPGGPYSGEPGQTINFSGSANDLGGGAMTYAWDWDNNGTYDTTGQTPTHSWPGDGNYTVGLKVTDSQGGEGTATFSVLITTTTMNIDLMDGWNLVSFNLHPAATPPATVLAGISGHFDLVYAWDAAGAAWMKYDPAMPADLNSLKNLTEKMGFWIRVNGSRTLAVSGTNPGTSGIAVSTGWNLVGYPSRTNLDLPAAFSGHGLSNFSLAFAYHASDTGDPWKKFDPNMPIELNDLKALAPGWGYWVDVNTATTWNVTY
jgi:Bacterial Ig domain/PKD domain